jgi:hypothetical protein
MRSTAACVAAVAMCMPVALWAEDIDLDALRTQMEKYQNVEVALAEGYFSPDNHCVLAASTPRFLRDQSEEYLSRAACDKGCDPAQPFRKWFVV